MTVSRRRLLVGAALPLLAAGCSGPTGSDALNGFPQGDGTFVVVAPDQRRTAAVLVGEDLDGAKLSTADYAGQVLVLNVWGSWCAPCRKEAPEVVSAAKQLAGTAQVLGINTRDLSLESAQAFVRAFEVPYPNFFDPSGQLLLDLAALPPTAIPSTVVLDAQGRIAARVSGATTASTLVGVATDVARGK